MSSQKEKAGFLEGSISSDEPIALYHSPEDEEKKAKLLQSIMPQITELVNQNISFDQFFEEHQGDFVQVIYNIINNYITQIFQGVLQVYTGVNPIVVNGTSIKLNYNDGLNLEGTDLEVYLDSTCKTGSAGAEGCGLEFNSNKLRVAPEDFLKTS